MVFTKVPELKTHFLEFLETNKEEIGNDMYDKLVEWFNQNTKKTRMKKEKEEKDPDRVKKSIPPSWLWKADNKEKIKADYFGGEDVKASMISQKAKEIWDNTVTDDEKAPYIEKYTTQMKKYREANPSKTTKKEKKDFNFDVDEDREIPDNWDGAHECKYLLRYANGRSIGEGRFDTFEKALNAANNLSECGGITMGKNGYTLRKGNDPITDNSDFDKNGPFVSWTKKDFTPPKKDEMKKKKKEEKKEDPKKEEKKEEEKKEESDETYNNEYFKQLVNKRQLSKEIKVKDVSESDEESDEESDTGTTWTAEDAKKAQETAEQVLESDSSDVEEEEKKEESEDESDDESDEEQVQVETWEYKGETYLVDNDNVVYDSNTEEKIGSRVQSKKHPGTWKLKKTN